MTRKLARFTTMVPLFLFVFGCSSGGPHTPPRLEEGLTGEQPDRIVVTRAKMVHLVLFEPGVDEPDGEQIASLNEFLSSAAASRSGQVLIERSAEVGDDNRSAILAGALAEKGLRPVVRLAAVPQGELRLTIDRYSASVPECPNWSKAPGNDLSNTLPSDFGCATATDLAATIVDPGDLIRGRDLQGAFGDPAVAAVQRYRTGKTTVVERESVSAASSSASAKPPGAGANP